MKLFLPRDVMLARYMSFCQCLSVRTSRGIIPKRLNVGSPTTAQDNAEMLAFWCQSALENSNGVMIRNGGAKYKWGKLKSATFDHLAISQKRCKMGT